jgi:hypothetical protein
MGWVEDTQPQIVCSVWGKCFLRPVSTHAATTLHESLAVVDVLQLFEPKQPVWQSYSIKLFRISKRIECRCGLEEAYLASWYVYRTATGHEWPRVLSDPGCTSPVVHIPACRKSDYETAWY